MDTERLVYIIAATFGLDYRICTPVRDLEAEDALTRALARNGGDGLTACHEDASACPKPCLRHRRVNVGIWPNWRCDWSSLEFSKWHDCPLALPGTTIGGYLDAKNCGTYQDHIANEELNRKTAAYIQNRRNQEWDRDPDRKFGGATVIHELANEPNPAHEIDTTWHAQYPEQVWNERSEPQWTVTSTAPRPFEGKTYRFDPISITVPLPVESPQPSASHQSLPAASPQPPSPDSAT